ncbi:MAG TPA: hypothetical protein V6C96_01085 [Vampirovibrionales bacterium]
MKKHFIGTFSMPKLRILILILTLFPITAHSELFKNSYLSFELPPHWTCKTEVTEWYCVSQYSQKAKEAIIVLTAKEKGPSDSLIQYESHLKEKKAILNKSGKETLSHVYTVKQVQINGHTWVDGLHINAEIDNYYTRYLGTTKDQMAILVTFSGHKEHYTKYSQDFFNAIKSLRVNPVNFQQSLAGSNLGPGGQQAGTFGASISDPLNTGFESMPEESTSGWSDTHTNMMAIALILFAVGFYIMKKRKKKK